ncbi:MAG: hypothetical protein IH588_18270 [Anaerolineales bacterium]|nr:hypothetical protein [Anaerolineales bacterium]
MTDKDNLAANTVSTPTTSILVGFYSAVFTTIMTVVTFSFAITAMPISGANCLEGCIEYPYLDTISQFPKDYLWMYPATILILSYVILMISIHSYASQQNKIFGQIGVSFAIIAALTLLSDYFIQYSIIPVSLMNRETEGIPLLTQYNPHGVFIALEELGYLIMNLSFLFVAPVFTNKNRLENAIRWVFVIGFVLAIISLIMVSINYGLDRQDRFEVAVISINWLILIINGILLSILFKRQLKEKGKVQ